jgi:hypothetical protein
VILPASVKQRGVLRFEAGKASIDIAPDPPENNGIVVRPGGAATQGTCRSEQSDKRRINNLRRVTIL